MRCNICGGAEFLDMNVRKGVRCGQCGSLERTRLLWLYLERLEISNKTRIVKMDLSVLMTHLFCSRRRA